VIAVFVGKEVEKSSKNIQKHENSQENQKQ
jgi:hypothetical protein